MRGGQGRSGELSIEVSTPECTTRCQPKVYDELTGHGPCRGALEVRLPAAWCSFMATTSWLVARDALEGAQECHLRQVQGQGQGNFGPEIADDKSVVMLGRIIEWKEHGVDVLN